MSDLKRNSSSNNIFRQPVFAFALWLSFQSCASTTAFHRDSFHPEYFNSEKRTEALDKLGQLSVEAAIGIDSPDGAISVPADLQFRTTDTLFIQIYDPLGRKLARAELNGAEYSILFQRDGTFFSGSDLPTELGGFEFPTISAEDFRRLLLGLPLRLSSFQVAYFSQTSCLKSAIIGSGAGKWEIHYRSYESVTDIPLPSEISFRNRQANVEIQIHLSNFSAALRKFAQ
ncbi:MAG: lipoprotein insertase outer membrane protein LolB [Candidatus Neomarinimicrobiota bacterium]